MVSSFSVLALALSGKSRTASNQLLKSHYEKNQRVRKAMASETGNNSKTTGGVDNTITADDDNDDIGLGPAILSRRKSNVYTNLALGNRMENLMNTSTSVVMPNTPLSPFKFTIENARQNASVSLASECSTPTSPTASEFNTDTMTNNFYPHKNVENLRHGISVGIPIPIKRDRTYGVGTGNICGTDAHRFQAMNSPPTGRYSSNNHNMFYGSPGTSPVYITGGSYVDVYNSSGGNGGGSGSGGSLSRAASPQPMSQSYSGGSVSTIHGGVDHRLGLSDFEIFELFICFCIIVFL